VKSAFAELDRRRVEQLAQRPASALGARRLVAAFAFGGLRPWLQLIHAPPVSPAVRLPMHRGIRAPLASKNRRMHIPS